MALDRSSKSLSITFSCILKHKMNSTISVYEIPSLTVTSTLDQLNKTNYLRINLIS